MKIYKIHEAKTNFSKLIQKALMGERIVIAKGNTPLIELKVLDEVKKKSRVFGAYSDLMISISDDFNEELEDFQDYQP